MTNPVTLVVILGTMAAALWLVPDRRRWIVQTRIGDGPPFEMGRYWRYRSAERYAQATLAELDELGLYLDSRHTHRVMILCRGRRGPVEVASYTIHSPQPEKGLYE